MAVQDPSALVTADTPVPNASIPQTDVPETYDRDLQIQILSSLQSIDQTLKDMFEYMQLTTGG